MDRTRPGTLASYLLAVVLLALVPATVAAHGSTTGPHDHTLPIAVLGAGLLILAGSLGADQMGYLERSTADVGVVAGALGIVASIGLLWL